MREVTIAGRRIADDTDAFVIAEAGNNHSGSVETAHALIAMAAACGADAIKFQTRSNRDLYTRAAYDAPYHSENAFGPTYGTHREALELPRSAYPELKRHAEDLGLVFLSTAFDIPSADFLADLGVAAFKIASGDLTNIPLILHVARFGKPVIVSTGGGTLEDVQRVYDALHAATTWETTEGYWYDQQGNVIPKPRAGRGSLADKLVLLQCTAAYPVDPREMNLRVIEGYREQFPNTVIGLSDHFSGIFTGPVAYTLGARVFEKHVTLSHTAKGTDHAFSLEPNGLRRLVRDLRRTPDVLGDGYKRPYESEAAGVLKMGKSLVAARDLPAGHLLADGDLAMKSPGGGLPPYRVAAFIGRRLREPLALDQVITSSGVVE